MDFLNYCQQTPITFAVNIESLIPSEEHLSIPDSSHFLWFTSELFILYWYVSYVLIIKTMAAVDEILKIICLNVFKLHDK